MHHQLINMDNSISNTGKPLTREDIIEVESELSAAIPEEVKTRYLRFNGGRPDRRFWKYDWGDNDGILIQSFLPMQDANDSIEKVYVAGISDGYLIPGLVPFARDLGGNYICFDHEGGVAFYAMDMWDDDLSVEENKRNAVTPLTDSFSRFVAGLGLAPE